MSTPTDVLVVGASAGGLAVTEALRGKGYDGRIRLVGQERHPPYDRPPLSKEILAGSWPAERAFLRTPAELDALRAEFVLGRRAEGLDIEARTVDLDDGRTLSYDVLVVATGLIPRRLPDQHHLTGVHTLHTLDDADDLHRQLAPARHVAVIGAGVLGCEIVATARCLGLPVTLIDPAPAPMARRLGDELGAHVAALHRRHGVHVRTGVGVAGLIGTAGHVSAVELADGERVTADLVVVAIGATPAVEWLRADGLSLSDGIECDSHCRAAPGVYAVGDVARWHHEGLGTSIRLENRTNVTQQAMAVAADIMGAGSPYTPVPYFWSDQYDVRIQIHGIIAPGSRIRPLDGRPGVGRFAALAEIDGTAVAAIGWNHPRGVMAARRQVIDALGARVVSRGA
ncbi:NAD(P)/FAD-dependent oxidoreductase [Nonomuraea sp. NPDC049400]|uniref:NAD(P)/FAD-dependent oxidoreductase n=1 Tax=Nonomuraea sp. NPDC049400 TaxID=3364352 RepID=UPI0037B95F76